MKTKKRLYFDKAGHAINYETYLRMRKAFEYRVIKSNPIDKYTHLVTEWLGENVADPGKPRTLFCTKLVEQGGKPKVLEHSNNVEAAKVTHKKWLRDLKGGKRGRCIKRD